MQRNITVYQMDSVLRDKQQNLEKVEAFIKEKSKHTDFIVLPELFTTGYQLQDIGDEYYDLAEPIPGPTTERLASLANQYGVVIIGNIVEKDAQAEAVLYDTTFVLDKEGALKGIYRKVHIYPDEHKYFKAGNELEVIEVDGVKAGFATCYDHAFQEQFRILALKGAEVIFIPSAVPKGFEYLLELRTRARAQDNQIFTVAANRAGTDGDITWNGNSMIVNPKGEMLTRANDEETSISASIDLDEIKAERMQEPVFRSRRPELYDILVK